VTRGRRKLWIAIGLELLAAMALIGWRLTRSAPPEANLSRLPTTTATELRVLQARVWSDSAARWQELGEAYLAFGYFAEAEPCLRLAVERSPEQSTAVFAHACSLERLGRLAEANEQFAKAATLDHGRQAQTCHSRIARNCLRLDDVPNAEAAIAKAPALLAARVERARLLVRTGRARDALPILNGLREDNELEVRTEMIAVQAFRELGRPRDAATAAERAERAVDRFRVADHGAQLQPIRARYGLAAVMSRAEQLDRAGRPAEAAAQFDRALANASWDVLEPWIATAARLDMMALRYEAALEKLDRLATRMDVSPPARLIWGAVLAETDQLDRAIEQWRQASAAQPTAQLHRALAQGLLARGNSDEARRERSTARLQQAIDYYHANDLANALSELEATRSELPDEPRMWYYLGVVFAAMDQPVRAHNAFSRCLTLDPLYGRARYRVTLLAD